MAKFEQCYIRTDSGYEAIPYTRLEADGKRNPEFIGRYFLPFHGYLLEVPHEECIKEYKLRRRQKYIREEAILHNELSFHSLDTDEFSGEDTVADIFCDVQGEVVLMVMSEQLHDALKSLSQAERDAIKALYFDEMTERQYAELIGISQKSVNKRRHSAIKHLQELLEK